MAVLVIAEHDNSDLKRATRQAVSAAGRPAATSCAKLGPLRQPMAQPGNASAST